MDIQNTPTNLFDNKGQIITAYITMKDIKNFHGDLSGEIMAYNIKAVAKAKHIQFVKAYIKEVDECNRLKIYTVILFAGVSVISLFNIVMNFNQSMAALARLFGL